MPIFFEFTAKKSIRTTNHVLSQCESSLRIRTGHEFIFLFTDRVSLEFLFAVLVDRLTLMLTDTPCHALGGFLACDSSDHVEVAEKDEKLAEVEYDEEPELADLFQRIGRIHLKLAVPSRNENYQ